MSRVFSRASLSVRARVSDSSAVADRVLEMREISQPRLSQEVCPPTRKKALDQCMIQMRLAKGQPPAAHRSRRDARLSYRPRRSLMGSGASAGECAAAAAGSCVFGSVLFADMACGMPPAPPLLWPCLLLPMPKGMAAGHQQALAAQAEQRRIRGR